MVISAIQDFLLDFMTGFIDLFGEWVGSLFHTMYTINEAVGIDTVANYSKGISLLLIVAYAIKKAIDIYVTQSDGDVEADPLDMLTRVAESVCMACCGNEAIKYAIAASVIAEQEINALNIVGDYDANILQQVNALVSMASGTTGFIVVLMFVIMLIMYAVFVFRAAKRGAELMAFQIMMPLVAIDLITTSREKWKAFIMELGSCIFGYILQFIEMKIFFYILAQYVARQMNIYLLSAFGWMIVIVLAPKWLQKFIYSTGGGQIARGGMSTASTVAIMLRSVK